MPDCDGLTSDRQTLGDALREAWQDYIFMVGLRPAESAVATRVKGPARLLLNSQLRATLLVRLTAASPRWLSWMLRTLLVTLHSCEVMPGARIGPRLRLPHPFGIMIADQVVIGSDVSLAHNVTLGADLALRGQPRLGNDVTVLPGAVVAGPIEVGDGALVGANSVLLEDLPAGAVCSSPPPRSRVAG